MAQKMKHAKGDVLIPKLLENCLIMQKRSLRLDYKATESWLISVIKLIWGIFISVRVRTLTVNK
jgi:hypothetical protein